METYWKRYKEKIVIDYAKRTLKNLNTFGINTVFAEVFKLKNYTYLWIVDSILFLRFNDSFTIFESNIDLENTELMALLCDFDNYLKCGSRCLLTTNFDAWLYKYIRSKVYNQIREMFSYHFYDKFKNDKKYGAVNQIIYDYNHFGIKNSNQRFYFNYNYETSTVVILDTKTGETISWYKLLHVGRANETNTMNAIDFEEFSNAFYKEMYKLYKHDPIITTNHETTKIE